ncbi:MAG: hypothetical protein IJ390_06780 [Lachnospiraceae bacterium]|nr:hypothetical protein [Lachnospiraceae bacterium]
MKYTVGLQYTNEAFLECIIQNKEHIDEVYFAWGDFPNGRTNQLQNDYFTPWELQSRQIKVLGKMAEAGIGLNLLFNANCYGKDSQSRAFFEKIGMTVDYIESQFGLKSVTTTSPLIAKFVKNNFKEIAVRASVNMEIGTTQGMDYLAEYFDGYYMKREWNRDFDKIKELSEWCHENGKKLYLLANSGCLNHCSAHNFHDNLVAHEQEISQMDNAYHFTGICREYLKEESHYLSLIHDTNFIRPEDIHKYEPYFESVKLATRVHKAPVIVLNSYIREKYSGNILELLEPAHSIYPYVVENGEPLKLVRLT